MSTITIQFPRPEQDETFERYAIRTHRAMQDSIADPEERNDLIEEVWRELRGRTDSEQMALDKLGDPDKFTPRRNVCLFTEHETVDGQGNPRKYDLPKLVKILRNANERIADVGAFPAISDGHTPGPETPDAANPETLGYVGNYRLGMIGRKNPRWAIFADEYHDNAKADVLRSKPRRSVELWTFKDSGKAHFDPIAALGSEAPRLPLPVQFQLLRQGDVEVERYQIAAPAAAPVAPGGGNTFVKPFKKEEPEKMALSDEDVALVVGALAETPQWQWLDRQMKADMASETAEVAGDLPVPDEKAGLEEAVGDVAEEAAEVPAELPGEEPPMPQAEEEPNEYAEDEEVADLADLLVEPTEPEGETPPEEEEQVRMSAKHDTLVERYSQLSTSHNNLIQAHGALQKKVSRLEQERSDGHRKATILELGQKYPGSVVVDEEFEACLYSAGSAMTDEQFTEHVATVEKYASRAPMNTPMIPAGAMPDGAGNSPEVEKYEQQVVEKAVELCTAAADRGDQMTYDEGMAEARKQLAAT